MKSELFKTAAYSNRGNISWRSNERMPWPDHYFNFEYIQGAVATRNRQINPEATLASKGGRSLPSASE